MANLFIELKRRNVFRVGVAYVVVAWLLAQAADLALENFAAPEWVIKTILLVLALGFPLAVFFAWAFELTPEGLKLEKDVDRTASITGRTGRRLDYIIIGTLMGSCGLHGLGGRRIDLICQRQRARQALHCRFAFRQYVLG